MADKQFSQKNNLIFNNIPGQVLTYANQLTIKAWNDIINILRVQTNTTVDYLKKLHTWLIGDGESFINYSGADSFFEYIKNTNNTLDSKINNVHNALDSKVTNVHNTLDSKIKTVHNDLDSKVIDNKNKIEEHYKHPIHLGSTVTNTINAGGNASVNIKGYGSQQVPLDFMFNIPKGHDGKGVHLFNIDPNTGDLVVYASNQEDIDNYQIDPDTGELFIVLEG